MTPRKDEFTLQPTESQEGVNTLFPKMMKSESSKQYIRRKDTHNSGYESNDQRKRTESSVEYKKTRKEGPASRPRRSGSRKRRSQSRSVSANKLNKHEAISYAEYKR